MKRTFLILGLMIGFWPGTGVLATDSKQKTGFSLSPPFSEIVMNKGDKEKSFVLKVTNNTKRSENFRLSVMDFGGLDESGGVAFVATKKSELENRYSLASWVSLEKDALVVDPGTTVVVKVTIVNKDSLSPGGHYAAILINLESNKESGKDVVGVNQSFSSLIFVKKTGGEIYKMDLKNAETDSNWFSAGKTVRVRFQNSGNVHLIPRGVVKVEDGFKRIVAKGIINNDSSLILPENFRKYLVPIEPVAPAIWPGVYKVLISYRYDGLETTTEKQLVFFYLGWPTVGGLILIFLAGLVRLTRRKKK